MHHLFLRSKPDLGGRSNKTQLLKALYFNEITSFTSILPLFLIVRHKNHHHEFQLDSSFPHKLIQNLSVNLKSPQSVFHFSFLFKVQLNKSRYHQS